MNVSIHVADLSDKKVIELLEGHSETMKTSSHPMQTLAPALSDLRRSEITVWTVWQERSLVGVGALKTLGSDLGELKLVRTHANHLRKGIGACLLNFIIVIARSRGMKSLSLVTGTGTSFEAANALYRRMGFIEGAQFSDYSGSQFDIFFHLAL